MVIPNGCPQDWSYPDIFLCDLSLLADAIGEESNSWGGAGSDDLSKLQQRTWLLHWSLFVFFNNEVDGRYDCGELVEFFTQKPMLRALQATSPHLLRYVAACVVIENKKPAMRDVCRVLRQESARTSKTPPVAASFHNQFFSRDARSLEFISDRSFCATLPMSF